MGNEEYIERLKQVIFHLHKSDSRHLESVPVREVFQGQTVWQGVVEVFELTGHPKAKRCYAWSHQAGKDDKDERFVAVLGIAPVDSAQKAVRAAIIQQAKSKTS